MTRLGSIDFDDCILDALRDDNLVVFAGAGVSMGAPSSLDSFKSLVIKIAHGTGLEVSGPLDRFLGQLHHNHVPVHERAVELLSPSGSAPNSLHHDLLRMFKGIERVRIVTTNFDQHFETAAQSLFGKLPDIYRAPALPLGNHFSGIVYVHGVLTHAHDLVLTDADFGRAYLTEGWARRFLVDLFHRYTVLFVGYSHDDVVMNYLSRALPADSVAGRFALTNDDGNWNFWGIKPIRFNKSTDENVYSQLYTGIQLLAERSIRGVMDWKTRMAEIAGRTPPVDENVIGEIEQALREVHTTRFFVAVASDPEWPKWLNARKHLDALFKADFLNERDTILALWLADTFSIEHPDAIFYLLAVHNLCLNPQFWWHICRKFGNMKQMIMKESFVKQWISILLSCAPSQADRHALLWLAECCGKYGIISYTCDVFLHMCKHYLIIKPGFIWYDKDNNEHGRHLDIDCQSLADHWSLEKVWKDYLKPNASLISRPLFAGIVLQLVEMHRQYIIWEKASRDWDPISSGRPAIEPHQQNHSNNASDILINIARDLVEWCAISSPKLLDAWIEQLLSVDVPILRRIAIHAVSVHAGMSSDDCLKWMLDRIGLYDYAGHHEVHRLVFLKYPTAGDEIRQSIINAILLFTKPDGEERSVETQTAYAHFEWLSWIQQAKPDCRLIETAIAPIISQYPEWRPIEHPDLLNWSYGGWSGHQSPWTVEQLLMQEPCVQVDELLSYKGKSLSGPDRDGLILTIKNACKQKVSWGFALKDALVDKSIWSTDLWSAIIHGWQESELTISDWHVVFTTIARPELFSRHQYSVSDLLYTLVKEGGKPFANDLIEHANEIALLLWDSIIVTEQDEHNSDWLSNAINHPAGKIVEFWMEGISLMMHDKSGSERYLPDNYQHWFTLVLQDETSKGGLGRSVLASQTAFFFGLDETWTRNYIFPLFINTDQQKYAQAWDGFLVWGHFYSTLADAMTPIFICAIQRINSDIKGRQRQFIEFYTTLVTIYTVDPRHELLPSLFRFATIEDRTVFASHLGYYLSQMQSAAKIDIWDRWLLKYWQDRLQSIPAVLDESEIRNMLEWLPHLDTLFPMAVSLAIKASKVRLEHCNLIFALREHEIVTRYPIETAELLIYLCECEVGYHANELGMIASRLADIPADIRRRLDDGMARIGAI